MVDSLMFGAIVWLSSTWSPTYVTLNNKSTVIQNDTKLFKSKRRTKRENDKVYCPVAIAIMVACPVIRTHLRVPDLQMFCNYLI